MVRQWPRSTLRGGEVRLGCSGWGVRGRLATSGRTTTTCSASPTPRSTATSTRPPSDGRPISGEEDPLRQPLFSLLHLGPDIALAPPGARPPGRSCPTHRAGTVRGVAAGPPGNQQPPGGWTPSDSGPSCPSCPPGDASASPVAGATAET